MSGIRNLATLAVLTVLVGATLVGAQDTDLAAMALQRAIRVELVDGDLQTAIVLCEEIAERFSGERAVAATALWHLGQCYEKLGDPEARAAYERVLRDYAGQAEQVAEARERLAALDVEPTPPAPTLTVREVMRSGPVQPGEIQAVPTTAPAVSADGHVLVYTDWSTGDLARLNLATGEVHRLFDTDWDGDSFFELPVFSPDEKRVAFVRYANRDGAGGTRIEISAPDGRNRDVVYDFEETVNATTYAWSPDGTTILLAADAQDKTRFLATLNIEHKELRRLLTLDWQFPMRAQYSPDGRFIAYDSTKDGDSKIYLITPDGAQERVLVESSGNNDSPTWTRDGRFLLFRSDRSGKWDLRALPMRDGQAAGRATVVMSLGELALLLGMTDEGQLFYSDLVDGRDIVITERIDQPTDTAPERLLPKAGTTEIQSPSFSPDGKHLAYLAGPPGASKTVRVTDLQGTVLREVPLDGVTSAVDRPMFSPDGRRLAFRVYERGEPTIMVVSVDTETVLKDFFPYENGLGAESSTLPAYVRILGWTADGQHLLGLFRGTGVLSLDTIEIERERVIDSISLSPDMATGSLSPSGEHLLLGDGSRLVLHSLRDGRERQLGVGRRAIWDSDSRHVFLRRSEEGTCCSNGPRLYSLSLDTGEETVLVEDMKNFRLAAVSPDGQYWALQNDAENRDLRMMVLENFLPASPAPVASQANSR